MDFHKIEKGHYRAFAPDNAVAHIRRKGAVWELEIIDRTTNKPIHAFTAPKQYLCAQEANRHYGHGAYGDP